MTSNNDINALCRLAATRLDDLLDALGVEYLPTSKGYSGCCPVHEGADNDRAWMIYKNGDTVPGFWRCYTHHCEEEYDKNLLGLVKGIRKKGPGDAIKFLEDFTQSKCTEEIKPPESLVQSMQYDILESVEEDDKEYITRTEARKNLQIPCQYFLRRGFSPAILNMYDVGYSYNMDMFPNTKCRAVIPIYDDTGTYMVGYTARIIYEKCKYCKKYHIQGPCLDYATSAKWRHSEGLHTHTLLYNWWSAKHYIRTTGTVILVEGPGDVWKLEEAGFHNSVAIFGSVLSLKQKDKIDKCMPRKMLLVADNDEAGRKAIKRMETMCGDLYNICVPRLPANDIGDMSIEDIRKTIFPLAKN